ncbi:serine/arginine repetitive matrix protein 1-like isoform X2 [Artemia franciscana]|uniref:serine/arginine repetitive matrix protein 1-like isoform X2 n=1 Tax=Artemia franciscana TaxID=6661 RepID=UPI0032DB04A4
MALVTLRVLGIVLRSTGKAMRDHGIKWRGKTLLDLDYADDLSILDENASFSFSFDALNEISEEARDLIKHLICSANQRLGRNGLSDFKVVATTRHVEESTELKECLKKAGEDPVIKMDVTDDASIEAALKETQKRIDKLDILINNAGITNRNHPEDKALEINRQEMLDVYNTDVVGALVVTRAFRPLMEKSDVKKVKGNGFCVPFVPPGIKCMKIPYSPTIFEAPRIIRPTIFDLFVADPTVIPQDPSNDPTIFPKRKPFEGDERVEEGYNPRSLPRRSPSQDAHEPSESPPPPSPYNKDQDPGDKGKSDTPYNEPPPESIRRGGPKKDPPKDPDTGQRSASRKSKEEEIIRQGHREPQPSVNRIRGRKYTPEEQREDKNPATSPSGRNITGPLVSVNRLRRNRPKQAFPSASMEGKKPTEDPSKPKGDIKGDPDRVGGYGGSNVDIEKEKEKEKKKSASRFCFRIMSEKGGDKEKNDSRKEPLRTGVESQELPEKTEDWLPGEPSFPKQDLVEEESVVGEPPKPEDMASSAPVDDGPFVPPGEENSDLEKTRATQRESQIGIRSNTPDLIDIFYEEIKHKSDDEFVVVNPHENSESVEIHETNIETTFKVIANGQKSSQTNSGEAKEEGSEELGKPGSVKKPHPYSIYTGEDKANIYEDSRHIPEISPERPTEFPEPRHHQEWQPNEIPEAPSPPRPSPSNDPTGKRSERKHGPYPKRPSPDPGKISPGPRGPLKPPSPGDSNPLPSPGGPVIPPDPALNLPQFSNQKRSFRW